MNERRVVRDTIGPLRKSADALKSFDTDILNTLDNNFSFVFINEDTNIISEEECYEELHPLEKINFSVKVQKQLYKLNKHKSIHDQIICTHEYGQIYPKPLAVIDRDIQQIYDNWKHFR